jgi:hypothetical protein
VKTGSPAKRRRKTPSYKRGIFQLATSSPPVGGWYVLCVESLSGILSAACCLYVPTQLHEYHRAPLLFVLALLPLSNTSRSEVRKGVSNVETSWSLRSSTTAARSRACFPPYWFLLPAGYGWMPHNASFGFLDRPRAILSQIHF